MKAGLHLSPRQTATVATVCLLLILAVQFYLVYDYFRTTRKALIRETDAIMEEVFRNDLNKRILTYKHLIGEDTVTTATPPPPPSESNSVGFDMRKPGQNPDNNVVKQLDCAMNSFVSKLVAMDIRELDLHTREILHNRQINSDYTVRLLEMPSGKISESSKKERFTLINISSQPLIINPENTQALQLVLINPLGIILKNMGVLLLLSLILSLICIWLFRYLQNILAKQKQLVTFKNDFLGTIAHELKRPVATLTTNLSSLSIPGIGDNPAIAGKLIDKSLHTTREMEGTIRMIISLGRAEEGVLSLFYTDVNLNDMVNNLRENFSQNSRKKTSIYIHGTDHAHRLRADEQLLQQCFANLIDNSIKYSDEEVDIHITLSTEENQHSISFQDNGWGIPADKLPVIFEKYSRAHPTEQKINSYGIGLNYVHTIIKKHGGSILVNSREKEGTTFIIHLPLNQ